MDGKVGRGLVAQPAVAPQLLEKSEWLPHDRPFSPAGAGTVHVALAALYSAAGPFASSGDAQLALLSGWA